MNKIIIYIFCVLYILFISVLNALFIYITVNNYETTFTGFFKIINIIAEVFIDLLLLLLTYLMIYLEFNYYIKNKNNDIFKYLGEIKSKKTRLLFGIVQVFISFYYIKNNTNKLTNTIMAKTILGFLYLIIGIINIILSFFNKFTIRNKNRDSLI